MNERQYVIQDLKSNKGEVQDARMIGPSGSGSITVDDSISNSSENPVQNKVISTALGDKADSSDLSGYEPKATVVTDLESTSKTITPAANTIYNCGELTSLTISNPTATGSYSIVFTSGSTATTTTIPSTILGLENFAAEANTLYEINVLDNRAVVGSWAVTP